MGAGELNCNYSPTSLSMFTDEVAKSFNKAGLLSYLSDEGQQVAAQTMKECKKNVTLNPSIEAPYREFLSKLQFCTPSTHVITKAFSKQEVTISGFQNDKCIVRAIIYSDNKQTPINCAYSKASLALYVKIGFDQLAGVSDRNLSNEQTQVLMQQIMSALKECDKPWLPI